VLDSPRRSVRFLSSSRGAFLCIFFFQKAVNYPNTGVIRSAHRFFFSSNGKPSDCSAVQLAPPVYRNMSFICLVKGHLFFIFKSLRLSEQLIARKHRPYFAFSLCQPRMWSSRPSPSRSTTLWTSHTFLCRDVRTNLGDTCITACPLCQHEPLSPR